MLPLVTSLPEKQILNGKFILLGELHGVKENALLVRSILGLFIEAKKPVSVGFEWSLEKIEKDEVRNYILKGTPLTNMPAFFADSDGRFTYEHLDLLKWIRDINEKSDHLIDVVFFDSYVSSEGIDRENEMANVLIDFYHNTNRPIVIETGVIHARKKAFNESSGPLKPMAVYLAEKYDYVVSYFLKYEKGETAYEGQAIDVMQFESQVEGPKDFFDGVIEIENATPALDLIDLTKIHSELQ